MLLLKWMLFLVVGRIVVHIWQQFHLPGLLGKIRWLSELHGCDLCSGVWIYFLLSFFMEVDLLDAAGFGYIPIVGAVVTGIVVSWLVHIFIIGWKAKYEVVVI